MVCIGLIAEGCYFLISSLPVEPDSFNQGAVCFQVKDCAYLQRDFGDGYVILRMQTDGDFG